MERNAETSRSCAPGGAQPISQRSCAVFFTRNNMLWIHRPAHHHVSGMWHIQKLIDLRRLGFKLQRPLWIVAKECDQLPRVECQLVETQGVHRLSSADA